MLHFGEKYTCTNVVVLLADVSVLKMFLFKFGFVVLQG